MFWSDITELQRFYDSRLGQICAHSIKRAIGRIWAEAKDETIIGIGYTTPFLRPFIKQADIIGASLPAEQGAMHWASSNGENATLLSHEAKQPFRSDTINRIIMAHVLEYSHPLDDLLKEAHRLLTPSGRMLVIVPNRRSLWARVEYTPYAQGQPYSLAQLKRLLTKFDFHIVQSHQALFFPPIKSRAILRFSKAIERIGHKFLPHFGGVLLVEVEKLTVASVSGKPIKSFTASPQTAQILNRNKL